MMAYSELIKNFDRIRDFLREFFVYGFRNRGEYDAKSGRTYDDERRRMESWLGSYMSFRREASGKNVFISIDSRSIRRNPLYNAFKAKSFTANDLVLHFYILDILADGGRMSVREILEKIDGEYLSRVKTPLEFDESTVRKKLKEYESLGLLCSEKSGKQVLYARSDRSSVDGTNEFNDRSWKEAAAFFSEADPLGVIGSTLLDRDKSPPDYFGFKHHYILHAMESEILYGLLDAIHRRFRVELKIFSPRRGEPSSHIVVPLKIYISAQNGRRYLLAYNARFKRHIFYRLDSVRTLVLKEPEPAFERYEKSAEAFRKTLWGVAAPKRDSFDHVEMDVRVKKGEQHIIGRLNREKRGGSVCVLNGDDGEKLCRFSADVKDAAEMLPWLRTFIGRIADLRCSEDPVIKTFREDIRAMEKMYGVNDDAVL
ncbi:MAG: WYL domain-containing transcriptional regulator [Synergistaceae bacterium]|jgi:DNA-binding transcriptional ArsR family regulator|nr:WYL domain-containing transcriptional regulator [Synergistaceae bacterium]